MREYAVFLLKVMSSSVEYSSFRFPVSVTLHYFTIIRAIKWFLELDVYHQ